MHKPWGRRCSAAAGAWDLRLVGDLALVVSGAGLEIIDVADPANPVPYTPEISTGWHSEYMAEDQRFAGRRPVVCEPGAQCLIGGELPILEVGRAELVK